MTPLDLITWVGAVALTIVMAAITVFVVAAVVFAIRGKNRKAS